MTRARKCSLTARVAASIAATSIVALLSFDAAGDARPLPAGVASSDLVAPGLSELSSDVVYAASRRLQYTEEAPAIVRVFNRADIRRGGYRGLNQLLATIPEIEVVDATRERYLLIKGTPFTVLVLVDGVSIVSHGDNQVDLDRLVPIEIVRKVEVVLSPGAVLWGARSIFGVVNIITRELTDERRMIVSAGGGWYSTLRAATTVYSGWDDLRWQLHLSAENSRNPTLMVEDSTYNLGRFGNRGETENDASLYLTASAALRWRGWFVRTLLNHRDHRYQIAHVTGARQAGGFNSLLQRSTYLATAGYRRTFRLSSAALRLEASTHVFDQPYVNSEYHAPPSTFVPRGMRLEIDIDHQLRLGAQALAQAHYASDFTTTAGVDATRASVSDVTQRGYFPDGSSTEAVVLGGRSALELSLYAQQEWTPHPALNLAAGVRYNLADSYEQAAFAHGHVVYEPIDGLFAKVNYSEGFRPPSFEQRFLEADVANLQGSTDLHPERSRALEGQLVFVTRLPWRGRLRLDGSYTFAQLRDLIGVLQTAPPQRFDNLAEEQLHTISASARLRLDRIGSLALAYAHTLPGDDTDGNQRRDFARDRLAVEAAVTRWPALTVSLAYAYTGSRLIRDYIDPVSRSPTDLGVAGFHELALSARFRLWTTGLTVAGTLRNLLAQDYDHVAPYTHVVQIYRAPLPRPDGIYGFVELEYAMDL